MGAILDGVEALKDPVNAVIFVAVLIGGYFFVKWAIKDDDSQE